MSRGNNDYQNSQNYKREYGQNYSSTYEDVHSEEYNTYEGYDELKRSEVRGYRRKNNNLLVVITLCVAVMALIMCSVLAIQLISKNNSGEDVNDDKNSVAVDVSHDEEEPQTEEPVEEETTEEETKPVAIPVGRTMYVDVSDFLWLRSGPGTENSELAKMYPGESVYVIEYVTNDFARVIYNGQEGYAAKRYLSDEKPVSAYQWNYSEYEVESLVAQSLNWYVNAVNTGDTSGAEYYFSGPILQTEKNNASKMAGSVAKENLISVNCYNFTRLSPSRVSVVRSSEIEIVELNGSSRIASEQRVYVLENTGYGTRIIDIHK